MTSARAPRSSRRTIFAAMLAAALAVFPGPAFAQRDAQRNASRDARESREDRDEEVEAFARVIVDSADLRSGPGISYRIIGNAKRGETLALDGRPTSGFWLRVLLPDGRAAYVLGDAVQPFAVHEGERGAPSRPGFFAPPPLEGARGGLAIVGGILSGPVGDGSRATFGYMEIRPQIVLHKTISLDGFLGDALTSDGQQLLYGAGATVHFFPSWAVCPFGTLGGGGLSTFPAPDSFVLKKQDSFVGRVGGGLLLALRNRILVRLEVTNLTLFTADTYKSAQTYAGGLGVYF
ncbi:SH3 domain-containing protein [Pendulispora albinea]|uniref:SH3 domain-containing protein n=1 Tax=Pendulispora albinea TaxID=2741071 RepID=A0ABZ2MAX7_9BACT